MIDLTTTNGVPIRVLHDLGADQPARIIVRPGQRHESGAWLSVADIKRLRKALKQALPPKVPKP